MKGVAHRIQVRPERYISMKNFKNKNTLSNDSKTGEKMQEQKFLKPIKVTLTKRNRFAKIVIEQKTKHEAAVSFCIILSKPPQFVKEVFLC